LTLPPTGFLDSAVLRAHFVTRGGQAVPLHADGKVVGEMIIVRRPPGRTLADEEREVIARRSSKRGSPRRHGPSARDQPDNVVAAAAGGCRRLAYGVAPLFP